MNNNEKIFFVVVLPFMGNYWRELFLESTRVSNDYAVFWSSKIFLLFFLFGCRDAQALWLCPRNSAPEHEKNFSPSSLLKCVLNLDYLSGMVLLLIIYRHICLNLCLLPFSSASIMNKFLDILLHLHQIQLYYHKYYFTLAVLGNTLGIELHKCATDQNSLDNTVLSNWQEILSSI